MTKDISTLNELEHLREILYGEQARTTEERLAALEKRIDSLEKKLSALATELTNDKVSRDTLGEILIEIGQRLKS